MDLITKTQLLNDTLPALSNNLRLDVKYTDMNGTAIAPEALKQGSDFMAVVTVANISGTTDYSDIALTHIIPSGWEIYNERMTADPEKANSADSNNSYSYRDIRDDRVLTYFNLKRGQYKHSPYDCKPPMQVHSYYRLSNAKQCMMPEHRRGHRPAKQSSNGKNCE